MPTLAIALPTGLVSSTLYPFTITVDGVGSIANSILDYPSLVIEDTASDDYNGQVSFRYWDSDNSRPLRHEAVVQIYDDTIDAVIFTGVVRGFHYEAEALGRWVVVDQVVHVGKLVDEFMVPHEPRPSGEGTKARFSYIWGAYAKYPLNSDVSFVLDVDASLPQDAMLNTTLGGACRQIAELSGSAVRFYVDAMGRPHMFSGTESTPGAAPFNINVAIAPGGGNIAPTTLTVQTDGPIKNRLYIRGPTAEGSGWYQDDASVATYGPREDYIDAPSAETAEKAQSIAQLQLGRVAQPNVRGSFSTASPNDGWRAGQNITLTAAQHGLSAYVTRLVKVRTTFLTGEAAPKRRYEMEFSDTGATLSGAPSSKGAVGGAVVGQVIAGTIVDSSGNSLLSTLVDPSVSATQPGFGAALRRYLGTLVYNGDWSVSTPAVNAQITAANSLPYWSLDGTGSTLQMSVMPDSATGSGYVVKVDAFAGSSNDEVYLQQLIPINSSLGQAFAYAATLTSVSPSLSTTDFSTFIRAQPMKNDGITTTGGTATASATWDGYSGSTPLDLTARAVIPADAAWLRVRVGVRRGSSSSTTGSITLADVRVVAGSELVVADAGAPSTYTHGRISKSNGTMIIAVPQSTAIDVLGAEIQLAANGVLTLGGSTLSTQHTDVVGRFVGVPLATASITGPGSQIPPTCFVRRISNTSGSLTLTSAPTIVDGVTDGQLLLVVSVGTQDVIIQDQGTLAGSNLRLSAATVTIGPRDSIMLLWSADIGDWVQVAQTNVI